MMTHLGVVTLLPDSTPHLTFDLVAIVAYPWHELWLEPNRHKLFVGRNIIRGIQRGLKRKLHWDCYLLFFQWDDRVGVKCIILCGTEKKKEEGKQYQRSPCKLSMSIPLTWLFFLSFSLSLSLSLALSLTHVLLSHLHFHFANYSLNYGPHQSWHASVTNPPITGVRGACRRVGRSRQT